MTPRRDLELLLKQYETDTTAQSAMRDLLTDLRHIADKQKLDFEFALEGSYEVYLDERAECPP